MSYTEKQMDQQEKILLVIFLFDNKHGNDINFSDLKCLREKP